MYLFKLEFLSFLDSLSFLDPRSGIAVVKNVVLTSVIFWILHESC